MQNVYNTTIESVDIEINPTLKNSNDISLQLERDSFMSEKEEKRFIKSVEGLIRKSVEYYEFVSYIRDTLGNKYCAFTEESNDETEDVEMHHHPFTLYDIVCIVTYNKIKNNQKFTSLSIAQEVLRRHFELNVGVVPLLGSLHKKYHNGYLEIPMEFVIGNYKKLFEIYYIDDETKNKVSKLMFITLSNISEINKWYIGLQKRREIDE